MTRILKNEINYCLPIFNYKSGFYILKSFSFVIYISFYVLAVYVTSLFLVHVVQYHILLQILDDDQVRDILVKMWSNYSEDTSCDMIDMENMTALLMCTYHISMDHYSEGPQMCLSVNKTLKAVVLSCFHNKKILSVQYVSNWIKTNIPRLLLPLQRYGVHSLTTSWRSLEENEPNLAAGKFNLFIC